MAKVIDKYKILNPKNPYAPITVGFCENCGTEYQKSQYGEDEECLKCQEWLDWENGNWLSDERNGR